MGDLRGAIGVTGDLGFIDSAGLGACVAVEMLRESLGLMAALEASMFAIVFFA